MSLFLVTDKCPIRVQCAVMNDGYIDVHVLEYHRKYRYSIHFDGVTARKQEWDSLSSEEVSDALPLLKSVYNIVMEQMKLLVTFYKLEGKDTYYANRLYDRINVPYKEDMVCNAIRNTFTTFMREA